MIYEYQVVVKDNKEFSITKTSVGGVPNWELSYNESFADRESAEKFLNDIRENDSLEFHDEFEIKRD